MSNPPTETTDARNTPSVTVRSGHYPLLKIPYYVVSPRPPREPTAHDLAAKGWRLMLDGDIQGAVKEFSKALELAQPRLKFEGSKTALDMSITMDGNLMIYIYNGRAEAREKTGDTAGAISDYQSVLRWLDPANPSESYLKHAKDRLRVLTGAPALDRASGP